MRRIEGIGNRHILPGSEAASYPGCLPSRELRLRFPSDYRYLFRGSSVIGKIYADRGKRRRRLDICRQGRCLNSEMSDGCCTW